MRRIGPSAEPTAPTPAKNASRAKSYPPGSAARDGGSRRALSSTKSPAATSGVLRVVTRTRRGAFSSGMPSAASTLITMRAPTVLKSTSSTKPCNETMRMRSSTGAATRAVRSDIERKPANSAARPSERPRARGRARETHASVAKSAVISAGSHSTGSRSAARLSATPPIAATGIHKKKRRSSTSRASARESAPRQSGAHAAARVRPAAEARAPVRAGVAIGARLTPD